MIPTTLLTKIDMSGDCWIWLAALDRHGYGVFRFEDRTQRAHRVVYQLFVGPTALELDHLCRNHACVNPDHLEPVTHVENVRRGNAGMATALRWTQPRDCPKGHPMSGTNLYVHYNERFKRINRQCKKCKLDNKRRYKAAKLHS